LQHLLNRDTQLTPSENRSPKSADGRVATEAAWLKSKDQKTQKTLTGKKETLTLAGLLMEGPSGQS